MISGSRRRKGARWPIFVGLALLCILVILGAGFLQSRTLATKVADQVVKAEGFVTDAVSPAVGSADLSQSISPPLSDSLDQKFSKGVLAGGSVVRVRLFATDGKLIYSTDESDQIGSGKVGDDNGIRAAAAGATTDFVDDDRVSTDGGESQSVHMLQAYVPLPSKTGGSPLAVVEVDQKMRPLEDAAKQPWRTVQLVAAFVAILFLELGLVSFARATGAKRLASRSGFAAAPTQASAQVKSDSKTAQKEAQVRQALEDQLETLRTQLRRQQEESSSAAREFAAQLQEASSKSNDPQRGAAVPDEAIRAADERIHAAELRAQEAERQGKVAVSRAEGAETRLAQLEAERAQAVRSAREAPPSAGIVDDGEAAARKQLEDLKAEHEAVRAELESARARHEAARADQEAMATRIGELERQSSETVTQTDVQTQRAESAEAKVAELQAQIDAAVKETAEQRNRADATEAVRMELETKLAQLTSRVQEADQRAAQLEEKVREAAELAREGNDKVLEAQRAGDVVRQEIVAVTSERDAIASERDALRAHFEERIRQADERAVAAEARLTQSAGTLAAESTTVRGAELEERVRQHEEALRQHEQAAREHQHAFEERGQELVKAHSRIDELEAAGRTAKEKIEEHAALLEQREGEITTLKTQMTEGAGQSAAALQVAESRTEETRMAWETKVIELEAELKAHQDAVRALELRAEAAERRAEQAEASLVARSGEEARSDKSAEHDVAARIAELERERDQYADELEQMQLRLRRAYADAEDARAQLQLGPPAPAPQGEDEVQRLRGELARAMDRAQSAENQASMLQADLAEARGGPDVGNMFGNVGAAPTSPDTPAPPDAPDAPAAQVDKSLRFRLARSAARKKGIGGEDDGDDDNMWS
jgi:hypothetical protein